MAEHLDDPMYSNSLTSTNSGKALLPVPTELEENVKRRRTNTISGILDNPMYINSLSCHSPNQMRLATACRQAALSLQTDKNGKLSSILVPKEPEAELEEDELKEGAIPQLKHNMRNLIVISLGFTIMYIATGSLRNLQSSINHEAGLGLYSLGASYASFMIGSLFTPFILKQFRPKKCMIVAIIPQTLYIASNMYPKFYILIPFSALQGFGNSIMWNAVSTYITNLSNAVAAKQRVKGEHITSKYFGIFFLILQWYVIIGNLVASLILRNSATLTKESKLLGNVSSEQIYLVNYTNYGRPNGTHLYFNISQTQTEKGDADSNKLCGSNYCHYYPIEHDGMKVDDTTKYILLGVYTACGIISLLVIALFLEPLKTYRGTSIECRVILEQLTSVIKFLVDRRFMMLWLVCMYGLMQNGFLTSEVTKVSSTCHI